MAQGCLCTEGLGFHEAPVAAQLFTTKMATMPKGWFGSVSKEGFICLMRFFIIANETLEGLVRLGVADANMDGEFAFHILKMPTTLQGYECFWSILLHASDDTVVTECVSLLNSIHENFTKAVSGGGSKDKIVESVETILKSVQQTLAKVEQRLSDAKTTRESQQGKFDKLVEKQRKYFQLVADYQAEMDKNARLSAE